MLEIILIAEAVLSVIILFVFFGMSGNISKIKDRLLEPQSDHYRTEYYKFIAMGDKEKAHEALVYVLITEILADPNRKNRHERFEATKAGDLSCLENWATNIRKILFDYEISNARIWLR